MLLDLTRRAGNFTNAILRNIPAWAELDHALLWGDLPTLAPPWNLPAKLLQEYFPMEEEVEAGGDHSPWLEPPMGPIDREGQDLERLHNTYAARMTYFDAQVGRVVDELRQGGVLDEVLLCVTASSGLALGEHGYVGGHRAWLHEEVVHVPLILRWPGEAEAGLRIPALTQPVDLAPTILDALGLHPMAAQGFSLLPLVRGERDQVRSQAVSGLQIGDSLEWSLRTPEWALLLPLTTPPNDPPRNPLLFVKPDDRWEVNEVSQQNLEVAEDLEKKLRDFAAGS